MERFWTLLRRWGAVALVVAAGVIVVGEMIDFWGDSRDEVAAPVIATETPESEATPEVVIECPDGPLQVKDPTPEQLADWADRYGLDLVRRGRGQGSSPGATPEPTSPASEGGGTTSGFRILGEVDIAALSHGGTGLVMTDEEGGLEFRVRANPEPLFGRELRWALYAAPGITTEGPDLELGAEYHVARVARLHLTLQGFTRLRPDGGFDAGARAKLSYEPKK